MSKEEKKKQARQELNKIKKKYGLKVLFKDSFFLELFLITMEEVSSCFHQGHIG